MAGPTSTTPTKRHRSLTIPRVAYLLTCPSAPGRCAAACRLAAFVSRARPVAQTGCPGCTNPWRRRECRGGRARPDWVGEITNERTRERTFPAWLGTSTRRRRRRRRARVIESPQEIAPDLGT